MAENDPTPQLPPHEAEQPGNVLIPGNPPVSSSNPPGHQTVSPAPAQQQAITNQPAASVAEDWRVDSPVQSPETVTWTASEFIVHHKSIAWYVALAVAATLLTLLVWFLTRDSISSAVVVFGAVMLGVYGGRQPRQLEYKLDGSGLTIGQKHYPYDGFRSFSIIDEGAFSSIMFMPLKRFSTVVSIYYAPKDEAAIADLLSARLPSEDHGRDPIDRLMHRIRF